MFTGAQAFEMTLNDHPEYDELIYDEEGNLVPRDPDLLPKQEIIDRLEEKKLDNTILFHHAHRLYLDYLDSNEPDSNLIFSKANLVFTYLLAKMVYKNENIDQIIALCDGENDELVTLIRERIIPVHDEFIFAYLYPSPLKVLEIISEIDYKYGHEISAAQ